MSRTCPYIFTRDTKYGKKGSVCGKRIKGNKPFCCRHMRSKQALDYLKKHKEIKEEPIEEKNKELAEKINNAEKAYPPEEMFEKVSNKRKREEEEVKEPPRKRSKLNNELTKDYQEEFKRSGGPKELPSYLTKLDKKLQASENRVDRLSPSVEVESDNDDDDSDDEEDHPVLHTKINIPRIAQLKQMSQQFNQSTRASNPNPVNDPVRLMSELGITSGNALLEAYSEPLLFFFANWLEKSSDKLDGLTGNIKSNPVLLPAYRGMIKEKAPDFLLNISDTKMFCIAMIICFVQTYSKNKFSL